MSDRLGRQICFLEEADHLKTVRRQSVLVDGSRRENSAEHSWHVALAALVLEEHADEPVDIARVVTLLLLHDVVEIDAGDTFLYDEAANRDKREREERAAERLFGLLPSEQRETLRNAWREFEDRSTPEARFAAAIDRLLPVLHNTHHGGALWKERGVTQERVIERNRPMAKAAPRLWRWAESRIRAAFGGALR